jgi:hypothetical protein
MIVIVKTNFSLNFKNKKKILFFKDLGKVSISSDDDIYQMIGKSYANRISDTNRYCDSQTDLIGTIVHGADWYEIVGSMQDYGYLNYGTIEMTMEISCCKYPNENLLMSYWNYNRDAMIELLFQSQRGLIMKFKDLVLNKFLFRSERFNT